MLKVIITCVGEITFTDNALMVVTGLLELVNTTPIPGCRYVPGAVTTIPLVPRAPVDGEKVGVLGIVGAGLLIETRFVVLIPDLPSGLITATR
jgi:hypothetical protein